MKSRVDEAANRKRNGYNCAQAVACSYCDLAEIDEDTMKNPQKTVKDTRKMMQDFMGQNGTVVCKELKGIDDGIVKRECIDCVKDAACLLEKSVFS